MRQSEVRKIEKAQRNDEKREAEENENGGKK